MTGDEQDRAISTVVDVALCLLFVSAAIVVVGAFVTDVGGDDHDPTEADQTAQQLAATTVTVDYSLSELVETHGDQFEGEYEAHELDRTVHGPTLGILADGAIANLGVENDGELEPIASSGTYEDGIEGSLRHVLTAGDVIGDVQATWVPHEGATVRGEARAGPTPPGDEDVSSVSMVVPSGAGDVQAEATAIANDSELDDDEQFEAIAAVLAEETVALYLPEDSAQRAIEDGGLERDLTVHRYRQFAASLEGVDFESDIEDEGYLEPQGNVTEANEVLEAALTERVEDDLRDTLDEMGEDQDPELAAELVSAGDVRITVRTWDP